MLYQLDTNFTLLDETSGIIENLSSYAMLEYATAAGGAMPQTNTGVRIKPGGRMRFYFDGKIQAFVRFLFVRAGDYTRQIAVVDDMGANLCGVAQEIHGLADAVQDGAGKLKAGFDALTQGFAVMNADIKIGMADMAQSLKDHTCNCNCGGSGGDPIVNNWEIVAASTEPAADKRFWLNTGPDLPVSADPAQHMDFDMNQLTNLTISETEPAGNGYWIKPIK